ncbi:hypothetical protein IHE45_17G116600 [Dioscorea alata]|uniref:Uncharacterized protein n=1 Tax=Dioscorea alata TaxID=55571 RepID=A0ACB7UEX8_DIOAL|nr:hypothetical protein IHE45_17G116600 [Dioscorea alata]
MEERTNTASEEPGTEIQNSVEAQENSAEEGDALPHMSMSEEQHLQLQTEKSPEPLATEDQPEINDARELAPGINVEQVREEEKFKESSHPESGETATQTQCSTEEQSKETEEGDASVHMSSGEQWSNEIPPVHDSSWANEVQLTGVDARELVPALSEDRMGNDEKLTESSNAASEEPGNEIQDSVKEQEKASEEEDASAQMSPTEELHLQLPIENSAIPSTTEDQLETDEAKELAPSQEVTEHEKIKESSNVVSGGPGTETQELTEKQNKETEEGNASVHMSAGELFHSSTENPSVHISASTTEAEVMGDDARGFAPAFTDGVEENENLKESSTEQSGELSIETQGATEEQHETTKKGDPSVQLSVTELHYLQTEKSPLPSKTEDQLDIGGSRESAPGYTQDQVIEEKLEEYSNVESAEPEAQTQDSTEEREETEEGDVSAHVSTCENLSMENSPAGISTSTTEAQLQEDDFKELAPALTEDRMEEDKKLIETSNVAPEIPATETEDSVEEQEKAIEEGDAPLQKSASEELHLPLQIEKSPVPSTTEDHLEIDDAKQLAPGFTKEHVKEENLKESSISEMREPGTEIQDATEVQDKEAEEGDTSAETSASNLCHLQYSTENPPLLISTTTTDAQLTEDDVKEPVTVLTENITGKDEIVMESSVVASKQPVAETQASVEEEEEKAGEGGDSPAQMSNSELPHMQLPTETSPKHTTEGQFETDETRELAPALIEEIVHLKESSNVAPGETGTETQGSTDEQEKANEEGFTSVQTSTSELHNLQLSDVTSPKNIHTSATEDKSQTDNLGDNAPALNPKDEASQATSTGTITQETTPDQEIIQQIDETENVLMTNTREVSEIKHAEVKAGIETPSDVIAIEHVDDLPKEFSEREILGADNGEASDPQPREDEAVAEEGKNLFNPAPEMIEATRTEMESTGNEPFIKNVEENSHDRETINENIEDVTSESIPEHQQTDYATYEKRDVSKTMPDEQKQQSESGNNLVEVKKDEADTEKNDIISESIDDNHSQDITCELGGKIENLIYDDKVEQMIPLLANPKTIHDAVDGMQEKVSSSISKDAAHELTNINENIGTGMEATDDLGTISDSIPEEQNNESIFSASTIKTENIPDVDTVDNKISEKVDLHEHAENAEINFEANFSKNLADTSGIHISISQPMVDNVSGHNEESSQKYEEEKHENNSTDLARDADFHEDEVECIEKHEIMSELIHEEQNQETTGEPETPEVEKRAYDEKTGPVSNSENLIEASMQKGETSILNVEETENAHIMSEEIPEKQDQKTNETETTEVEKRVCDEISESLSSSENLIADKMQKNESPMLDVEEHDNESSEVNDILENKLSDDDGAISGPSSEEKDASSVFEVVGTTKLGICLNQSEVETETISLDDNKDEIIPKDEETLYQTSDSSTVAENLGTPINAESRKLTINEGADIVNVEPKMVDEGCEDNEEKKFEEVATKSDDRDQYSEISKATITTKDADSHEQIKDSNIPNDGHDAERKADTETEKISSAEAETEPVLEEDKIVITPHDDLEDTTINDKEETETKLDTIHPSSIMVDQEDFRNQKDNQMELEKESNVSTRDMISNTEGKYYLASKEQSLETIAEINITKTKAAEDESKELEKSSSNIADDSLAEENKQEVEKHDMSPDLSDKTQVPESTDRDVGMDLDLLKGNNESLGQLENLATLESEDQSDNHITEIEIIKSDIAEGILPLAQDSTKDNIGERYTLPEENNRGHDMSEAEFAPLEEAETVEEAVFAASMQPQDILDDKINEDNGLECEEHVEGAETDKNQEKAMAEDEVCLRIEDDNQESTPVSVSDAAETTKEEDAETVITKEIDNKDATHKDSPGSKIEDLSINHDVEEEYLKGEASSPHSKLDNMESVTLEESEETSDSINKECQEVLDENESLEDVSIKNAKEHIQLEEQLDKLSERSEAANSIGEIEKEMIKKVDSSEVHDIACQKDEIAIEHMETGTAAQDTSLVKNPESEVKESDTVSVSSTSNEKPEHDLAISSSKEESAVKSMLPEPDSATEKTNRAKGSTESAAVSETIIANVSTDGNNVPDEGIANGGIPDIPELAQASAEDTIDTEIKLKVAEKEAIAEKGSTSANDTEDKDSPVSSSFTQATQVALPTDANEVVEDNAKRSHGVEESDNSQHEESLQSDPADLPVSRFLMDHILHQGDVPDEVGNDESKNNIEEETTSDKLMTISIQEQEIFMDRLSAELVPSKNIVENKDMEKLEDTILQQDNMPADVCDVEADNEIKQKHTTDEQMGTDIQEKEAIMDSVSAQQMPEEKSTSEDRDQEKPGDHVSWKKVLCLMMSVI